MKFLKIIFKVMCMVSPLVLSSMFPVGVSSEKIYSQIHEITSLSEIENYAQKDNPDMIVFDIDETLIAYKDAISQNGVNLFTANLKKEYELADDQADLLMSLILSTSNYRLMEDNIDELLNRLSKYSPNIIALTKCRTGPFGRIENVERWKTNLLKSFNITFLNHNFHDFNNTIFDNLLTEDQKKKNIQYPIFIDGILYTGKYFVNKPVAMKELLKRSNFVPKSMIFIDDQKRNLEDIKKAFEGTNIKLILLHYIPKENFVIDDKIVEIQKQILVNEQRWISDSEALKYLKNTKSF